MIELLVVISIISLLTAIMLPALAKVREQAASTLCKTNVRNLGNTLSIYACENNGKFWKEKIGDESWVSKLDDYCPDIQKVLLCPTADTAKNSSLMGGVASAWGPGLEKHGFDKDTVGSYGINGWLVAKANDSSSSDQKTWKKISVCQNDTPLFADCDWWEGRPEDSRTSEPPSDSDWLDRYLAGNANSRGFDMAHFCMPRHEKGVNVVFADGSVTQADLSDLWNIKWHRNFKKNAKLSISW